MRKIRALLKKNRVKEALQALEKKLEQSEHIHYYHKVCNLNIEMEKVDINHHYGKINSDIYAQKVKVIKDKTESILQELEKLIGKPRSIFGGIIKVSILILGLVFGGIALESNNFDPTKYTNFIAEFDLNSIRSQKLKSKISIFVYLNENFKYKQVKESLLSQLKSLEKYNISVYHNDVGGVPPGEDKEEFVLRMIGNADIFIPLISVEIINEEECLEKEIAYAYKSETRVVPIQIGRCDLDGCEALSRLDYFPNRDAPLSSSKRREDIDEQSFKIVQELKGRIFIWYE